MGTNAKAAHASYAIAPSQPAAVGTAAPETESDERESAALDTSSNSTPDVPTPSESNNSPAEQDPSAGQDADRLPVTPIPDTPDPGHAFGEPVLVGGDDLEASTATLVSYESPAGPRSVLHARVSEDAEAQLLDALDLEAKFQAVQVEQQVEGRLPTDETHGLADKIITAAKSLAFHVNNGTTGVASTTTTKLATARSTLDAVEAELGDGLSLVEAEMLAHYRNALDNLDEAAAAGQLPPQITPFLHEGTTLVTTMVPVAASGVHAPAVLRAGTRIKPTLDPDSGAASWDGTARAGEVTGKEYAIDLGDGFHAVYRPYGLNNPATTEYSWRGRLEIIAPPGTGQGPELVQRLGQLNLANRPMSQAEGEHSYLSANIAAQQLAGIPGIAQARADGDQLEEMIRQEIFHQRAHQAVGMTGPQLAQLARDIQHEARAQALPARVRGMRDAVAEATGFADGAALAASPGYDPTPRRSAGWLTWTRFDVGNAGQKMKIALKGRALVHKTSSSGLKAMLATGVLASTERRSAMGIHPGVGSSEHTDKLTGGASSVFLRMTRADHHDGGPRLFWDHPERLLARADYYGANGDTFGVVNPAKIEDYGSKSTRDPLTIATFTNSSNEVMFRDGIDLYGPEGPTRIQCNNTAQRAEIKNLLTAKGITQIAGRPIDDVLTI